MKIQPISSQLAKQSVLWAAYFAMAVVTISSFAQPATADVIEGFEDVPGLIAKGWNFQNLSTSIGQSPTWFQGETFLFNAQAGPTNSYAGANLNAINGPGTISNWIIMPEMILNNGDTISFWSRTADPVVGTFPDRLQLRMSTNGSSTNAGTGPDDVGDFTNLLLEINPNLDSTSYPTLWTNFNTTITGLVGPTNGRLAFRHYVTNGGPGNPNGNYIGIDSLVVQSVPEPGTAVGLLLLMSAVKLRRRR